MQDRALPSKEVLLDGVCEYAQHLYELREYKLSFDLFSALAKAKYTNALTYLGDIYSSGQGTKKNLRKALIYYKKAIHLNGCDETAMINLACTYRYQLKDYKKAKYWYSRLKKMSFYQAEALFELAQMHYMGLGVKANKEKAITILLQIYNDENLLSSLCGAQQEEVEILVEHQNDPVMWKNFSAKPCWII